VHKPASGDCNDGNPCTVNDKCANGICAGSGMLDCDDSNPCTDDSCAPDKGCLHDDNLEDCDDSNPCTVTDSCEGGVCVGEGAPDCDDSNVCTDDVCDPQAGCIHTLNNGQCSDEDICTIGDKCIMGECTPGQDALMCDDKNPCTTDSCNPEQGCIHDNNALMCDDSNHCTTGDTCVDGACLGQEPVNCNDGNICTDDSCDPQEGCSYLINTLPCDDADLCTLGDTCFAGECQAGAVALPCDDGNPCTDDSCDPEQGCLHKDNILPCDDSNPCSAADLCIAGACVGQEATDCDDSNPCTDDTCHPITGCKHGANTNVCEDGDACTVGDTCKDEACEPGQALDCEDSNVCTDDSCDSDTGCVNTNNNASCSDNNPCTLNDGCDDGECLPGPTLECNDAPLCRTGQCNQNSGECEYDTWVTPCCGNTTVEAGNGEECDDGNSANGDGCDAACQNEAPVCSLKGSYKVHDGPGWTSNPPCYSCVEACAKVFGGSAGDFQCSTNSNSINNVAHLSGWGDPTYCSQTKPETWKKNTYYNCGSHYCAYSAYVSDHCGNGATNYCFECK